MLLGAGRARNIVAPRSQTREPSPSSASSVGDVVSTSVIGSTAPSRNSLSEVPITRAIACVGPGP